MGDKDDDTTMRECQFDLVLPEAQHNLLGYQMF